MVRAHDAPGRQLHLDLEHGKHLPVVPLVGERRVTDGLKLPYRITTTNRGKIVDDLLLERIEVNPKLTKADFNR